MPHVLETRKTAATKPPLETDQLIAFCHIEKAAGTSLIHVLRRVFFLRYAAVRPLHTRDCAWFTAADLRTILKCNPFIRAIGGHSVVPFGSILSSSQRLVFITQFRDPIARAHSQYRFWNTRNIDRSGPESFLAHPVSRNFQVKKIAGTEDIELAKKTIKSHFLLAGTVERFDEFLVLLANRLRMPLKLFTYERKNVDSKPDSHHISQAFLEEVRERNQLDQQLYDWVDKKLYAEHINEYPGDFSSDLAYFRQLRHDESRLGVRKAIDGFYRNAYLKPISGLIRVANGLPFQGSYAIE